MKTLKALVLITVVFTTAFALAANIKVTLNSNNSLNGTPVNAGEYKLNYTTTGDNAKVELMQGKKTVATGTGQMVEIDKAPAHDSVVSKVNPDGSRAIYEIQFAGKKQAIRFSSEPAMGK